MQYKTKGKNFMCIVSETIPATHTENSTIIVAATKKAFTRMIKDYIAEIMARGNVASWNKDTVKMAKDVEWEDCTIEQCEFIRSHINTITGPEGNTKVIEHHHTKKRNPKYIDNPECKMCYKQTTKIYDQTALDAANTAIKVCAKCNTWMKKAKKAMAVMEATPQ